MGKSWKQTGKSAAARYYCADGTTVFGNDICIGGIGYIGKMNPQRVPTYPMLRKKLSKKDSFFQVSGDYRVFILYRDFPTEPIKQFSNRN